MALEKLLESWNSGKFPSSWIISTNDDEKTLADVTEFAEKILSDNSSLRAENNPDFHIVRRELNSSGEITKHISVDQIRQLQKFLSTTRAVSKRKIAVIYQAEAMNNNASNCCLKILEDSPKDSFLFLITKSYANLIPTIRSRCHKISAIAEVNYSPDVRSYDDFLKCLSDKSFFLKKLSSKIDKNDFDEFAKSATHYFKDLLKNGSVSHHSIMQYEKVMKMIRDTKEFDLDNRASLIRIIEAMTNS
ncbi:MAG: hypothetical protein KA998_03740 [Rickettsiaceae bacterium]|nr:hypothetical protein [Rickettsiaceae bacterium]